MSKQTSKKNAKRRLPSPLPPPQWTGAHALKLVHDLNERCLELLAQLARADRAKHTLEIVKLHRGLWRTLDAGARKRVARCPFLFVDLNFLSKDWWRWASDQRSRRRKGVASASRFPAKLAAELTRETLTLAWSTASSDPRAAGLLFGMAPNVAVLFAALGPQDIERIAARHSSALRLRWEDHPTFWRSLLLAAHGGDEALCELHLYGLQLLGSELIPLTDGSR